MRDPSASFPTMLGRALRKRCPRCAGQGIFASFYDLRERCPRCGLRFERESGYWVGAMIIVTAMTFGLFALVVVGGIAVTWPEVPWNWLLAITIGTNLALPALAYPRAKTLWSAMELSWHPLEPDEIAEASIHSTAPEM